MNEFTPETLSKFISQPHYKKNIEHILHKLDQNDKKKLTSIPNRIKELDSQIRNNLAEIIRFMIKNNNKEELIHLLEEHKVFIENILNIINY